MQTNPACALSSGYLCLLAVHWYFFLSWLKYLGVHYIRYIQRGTCTDTDFSGFTVPHRTKTPQELSWDALGTSFLLL